MRRRLRTLALAALLVTSVAASAATVSAASTDVSIQNVTASVDDPAPGESFTISTTISNLESSSGTVKVTSVYVRKGSSANDVARTGSVGSIAPGGTITVPLSASFGSTGYKQLTVTAVVQDENGNYHDYSYPLYVDVQAPDEAAVGFPDRQAVAGAEAATNVTVSNGDNASLSNVQLTLGGDATVENPERIVASLDAGTQETFSYDVTFPEAGTRSLNATLTYRTSDGNARTVHRNVTVDVAEPNVDVALDAATASDENSTGIATTLTEYGNVPLTDVHLRAVADGETVARAIGTDVAAESSQPATLDGANIPNGDVTVVAEYTAAGESRTTETSLDYTPASLADLVLTSVETTTSGTTTTLEGDIDNLGSRDVESVLVSVGSADGVTPAGSKQEYFVGSIDASQFSTFELTASVTGSADSVPVTVAYTVDGERRTVTRSVDVDSAAGAASAGSGASSDSEAGGAPSGAPSGGAPGSSGSGLPVVPIALGLVVIVVAAGGFALYRWRDQ